MKYRKKPVVIEAMQFTGNNAMEIEDWSGRKAIVSPVLEPTPDDPTGCYVQVKTPEGIMTGIAGDWIIKFEPDVVLSADCLRDIASFLGQLNAEKKKVSI